MTTTQQNLTFPYGTTPEEVIRECMAGKRGKTLRIEADRKVDMWMFTVSDHLLTVLDDLYKATPTRNGKWADTNRSYKLRIQILAALGIDEGGA